MYTIFKNLPLEMGGGADGYKYVLKKGVPNKRTFAYEGVGIRFSSLSCVRTN